MDLAWSQLAAGLSAGGARGEVEAQGGVLWVWGGPGVGVPLVSAVGTEHPHPHSREGSRRPLSGRATPPPPPFAFLKLFIGCSLKTPVLLLSAGCLLPSCPPRSRSECQPGRSGSSSELVLCYNSPFSRVIAGRTRGADKPAHGSRHYSPCSSGPLFARRY